MRASPALKLTIGDLIGQTSHQGFRTKGLVNSSWPHLSHLPKCWFWVDSKIQLVFNGRLMGHIYMYNTQMTKHHSENGSDTFSFNVTCITIQICCFALPSVLVLGCRIRSLSPRWSEALSVRFYTSSLARGTQMFPGRSEWSEGYVWFIVLPVCTHLCISTQMFPERSEWSEGYVWFILLPVCTHLCIS